MSNSITVKELIKQLEDFPEGAEVFMSSDTEGNSYSTIGSESFDYGALDKAVIIYPERERLDYDEVSPKEWERENEDDRSVE